MSPLTFELKENYDKDFTFIIQFSKTLSEITTTALNSTVHIHMSKLNSSEYEFSLKNLEGTP